MPALIRIITDGRAGMLAQARGLARAIAAAGGFETAETTVASGISGVLPPPLAAKFCQTGGMRADIVIGCGARAQPALLAVKKKFGAFAVCIEKPRGGADLFDAVVAPRHDYSAAAAAEIEANKNGNMILILGSVGGINAVSKPPPSAFAAVPNPKTGVLIGGENRAYSMTPAVCREFAAQILAADASGGVLATASRRTGEENARALAEEFSGGRCFFYSGADGAENPYADILAAADRFAVTCDSVNLLSEACAAGKPVQIIDLPQKSARAAAKFRRFHGDLISRGLARRWRGAFEEWTPPGLDETARAAEFVWKRYCAARGLRV